MSGGSFDPKAWAGLQARAALVGLQLHQLLGAPHALTFVTQRGTRIDVSALTGAEVVAEAHRVIDMTERSNHAVRVTAKAIAQAQQRA